jgi:hypothetical protein
VYNFNPVQAGRGYLYMFSKKLQHSSGTSKQEKTGIKTALRKHSARIRSTGRTVPNKSPRTMPKDTTSTKCLLPLLASSSLLTLAEAATISFSTDHGQHSYLASTASLPWFTRALHAMACDVKMPAVIHRGSEHFLTNLCADTTNAISIKGLKEASNSSAGLLCLMDYFNELCAQTEEEQTDSSNMFYIIVLTIIAIVTIGALANRVVPIRRTPEFVEEKKTPVEEKINQYDIRYNTIEEKLTKIEKENKEGLETIEYSTIKNLMKSLRDHNRCGISMEIMDEPITVETGKTYNKGALEKWFAAQQTTITEKLLLQKTCPTTKKPLPDKLPSVNLDMKYTINANLTECERLMVLLEQKLQPREVLAVSIR